MKVFSDLTVETWGKKYKDARDFVISDTWRRVAKWAASAEKTASLREYWEAKFYDILVDFKFIPGGRITESAGTKNCYANNCFFLDIADDLEEIFETVKRVAIISKKNGGCGLNFSKIRPKNSPLSEGGEASGPLSFMDVFDVTCQTIKTGSKNRRAALIALLDVSHPDIFDFIDAKRQKGKLENFNISVVVTDEFMRAVKADADWHLVFNDVIYRTVKAKELWDKLCYSGWMFNDPGIFFIDTVNRDNNMWYKYNLNGVNPCGELPLPNWGACCLGNINLTKFVKTPFAPTGFLESDIDIDGYIETAMIAVRFLDNILDVTLYPYEKNRERAQNERRIGLFGLAGLGSTLAMLKIPYDTEQARAFASNIAEVCKEAAYRSSIEIAKSKGPFQEFLSSKYTQGEFIKSLPTGMQNEIARYGIRNCAILTAPPVGTGSMLAGNISSGIEPIFALEYDRNFLQPDGTKVSGKMEDLAWAEWKSTCKSFDEKPEGYSIPEYFKTAMDIDPKDHIAMQAAVQKHIDGSISKTANLPNEYTLEDYEKLLMYAHDEGLKGFTTFRDGTREGVLSVSKEEKQIVAEIGTNESYIKSFSDGSIEIKGEVEKLTRPRVLDGKTYQIKEEGGHRTYATINHIDVNGEKKPWEVFLFSSSKNHELYAAIGRLASRLMRKTGDVAGVIEELKEICGDHGYLTPEYGFVCSKPQHLGMIMEEYVESLKETMFTDTEALKVYAEKKLDGKIIGICEICGANIVKRGGCSQCENGCIESYKCG